MMFSLNKNEGLGIEDIEAPLSSSPQTMLLEDGRRQFKDSLNTSWEVKVRGFGEIVVAGEEIDVVSDDRLNS